MSLFDTTLQRLKNIADKLAKKADVSNSLSQINSTVTSLTNTVAGNKADIEAKVSSANNSINNNANSIAALQNDKADKATTLSGYGITDAYTKADVDNKINNTYTKSETSSVVATEVAKIVANAPADYDTLQEIADYITADKTRAATIVSDISNLKTGKSDTDHTHDDRYYTESEIDTKIQTLNTAIAEKQSSGNYASPDHNHDDRYYTESEVDKLLAGKSDTNHTHSQYLTEHQDISGKQDKATYSTTDLTAGTSVLATGQIYLVYE